MTVGTEGPATPGKPARPSGRDGAHGFAGFAGFACACLAGTVGFFLPWHAVKTTRIVLCLFPDCKSSSYTETETCRQAGEIGIDWLLLAAFLAILLIQLVAVLRPTRGWRIAAASVTTCAAVLGAGLLLFHRAISHLFDTPGSPLLGELLVWAALFAFFGGAVRQLVTPTRPR